MQEYDEISDSLDRLIEGVRLFVKKQQTHEEMALQIQNELHHISLFGKSMGGKMNEDIRALNEKALHYLQNSDDPEKESSLLEHCLRLKNDLWEL